MLEPDPTPFDLRWRMFSVPVYVRPWFWVLSAVLGWYWFQVGGVTLLALWVGCAFLSILVHELGHVLAFRVFGVDSYVVLYSFGGLTIPSHRPALGWQRALVSLAGPGIQLILFVVLFPFGSLREPRPGQFDQQSPYVLAVALHMLLWINLVWPLFNLLPVWPMDGGHVCREVLAGVSPANGVVWSLYVSIACAAVLAVHCFLAAQGRPLFPFLPIGGMFGAIFFALFAMENFQLLQQEKLRQRRWDDDRMPWER
jgi:Zn-dependent protease